MKNGKPSLETVTGWKLTENDFSVLVYKTKTGRAYYVISPKHGLSVGIGDTPEDCMEIAKKNKEYINGEKSVKMPDYWYDPMN